MNLAKTSFILIWYFWYLNSLYMLYSIIPFVNHIMLLHTTRFPQRIIKVSSLLKNKTLFLSSLGCLHIQVFLRDLFLCVVDRIMHQSLVQKKTKHTTDAKSHSTPPSFYSSGLDCAIVHCIQSQHQERWRWSWLGKCGSVTHGCTDTCKAAMHLFHSSQLTT